MKTVMTLVCLLATMPAMAAKPEAKHGQHTVMAFSTMYAVDEAFIGETNAIRGVPGDELPWEIDGGVHGRLSENGRLTLQVRGLVFTHDTQVPPELQGINDETQFRALVSCLTEDGSGHVVPTNVMSPGFAATRTGNGHIDTKLELPEECIAPIVFILAGSEEKWFAVTGVSSESE